ncbi:scp1-like small phosphatase 4-related [Anaeramoeba flamelloides]|uniref:Scp1-like small phosphatase 4-related n=1 Tax=Anaeramoeba flamelloides TaxID=1746091 RepID=A0AAV7ZC28_9EUKA|nr:scp1-like small phosphatase 4-related [Anaeramoeba flamelloides]KAJ6231223.1 scp1-like small phosphatase 4-related [Anaeramoeba flamelloides]
MKKIKKRSYPTESNQQTHKRSYKQRSSNVQPNSTSSFISETRTNDELNFDSLLVNLDEIKESYQFTEASDLFLDFDDEDFKEFSTSSNFDFLESQEEIEMKKKNEENLFDLFLIPPLLAKQSKKFKDKMTLVLDLDQTLVFSSYDQPKSYDFKFLLSLENNSNNINKNTKEEEEKEKEKEKEENLFNNEQHIIYVQKRPYLSTFLERCSQLFEVVVFTAGLKEYADIILDKLDPNNELISHRLYRDSCKEAEQHTYVKDLSLLGRDLNRTLIIDDLPSSYSLQPQNAIPIKRFCGNCSNSSFLDEQIQDNELPRILKILEQFNRPKSSFSFLQNRLF